ncbi:MAG TPA: transglycosylase domain-containing protein, partial [Patescibacteria group bacterium]|nr:transglycosylase domain-containing protein [Patescibacteria group bacterium]
MNALPHPKLIGTVNFPVSTRILDRNGRLLYEIYHDQNRTPITLSSLPPYIKNATIAIEDKDFYRHQGVSLI